MLPMTTVQSTLEPVHILSSPRRSAFEGTRSKSLARTFSLLMAAALVVIPVAQERFDSRSETTARASSAPDDRSGALPSSELSPQLAEGRARVLPSR